MANMSGLYPEDEGSTPSGGSMFERRTHFLWGGVVHQYQIGDNAVYVDNQQRVLRTYFPDGTYLDASPNYDKNSFDRAVAIGYDGDTWWMSREHELVHTFLAVKAGLPYSPTLWTVANKGKPGDAPNDYREAEEGVVMEFQRYMNTGVAEDPRLSFLTDVGLDLPALRQEALGLLRP